MSNAYGLGAVPTISVIVPVYNVEGYVGACLRSLRDQTFADFEVIVVNDGSTDGSAAEVTDAIDGDTRFQVLEQENRGLSGARNAGLDVARGAFIAFVDSDDRVMPNYLWTLHDALMTSDADWAACAVRFCHADGAVDVHSAIHGAADIDGHMVPRRYEFSCWRDVVRHFPSAWNKLYRRALIDGLRFEEGVQFEDHGFFQRAAARTDHILHLPDALYLQTIGRVGQITARDDDRVFEQFDVLLGMRQSLDDSHSGAEEALGHVATRLIYERSTALKDKGRRARFARASVEFFAETGLEYDPAANGDPEIAQSWELEMAGDLPLSVVVPWHGRHPDLLADSLAAVMRSHGPAFEVLVICDTRTAVRQARRIVDGDDRVQVLRQNRRGVGAARDFGLAAARGVFVTFLDAGDLVHPWAYLRWVEAALKSDADLCLSQYRFGPDGDVCDGFLDPRFLPTGAPATGVVAMTPALALTLAPQISAKVFRRQFLLDKGLAFGKGGHADWGLVVSAAILSSKVAYLAWAGVAIGRSQNAESVVQARWSVWRLWRDHRHTVRDVCRNAVAQSLPNGWQRRLFARALRDQLHFGRGGRMGAAVLALGAAAVAALHGYARATPAGLDPFVGSKQALLLDLRKLVVFGWARLWNSNTAVPVAAETTAPWSGHRVFKLNGQGSFGFRAVFQREAYANVTFHADDPLVVPLHLSLRFNDQKVVYSSSNAIGVWGAEHAVDVALPKAGVNVCVMFGGKTIDVLVEGERVLQIARCRFWRRGVGGTDRISTFTFDGGVRPTLMLPERPAVGEVLLDGRLQVRASAGPCELRAGQTAVEMQDAGATDGVVAVLPGRVWLEVPSGGDLALTLHGADQAELGKLILTRQGMAARIADILDSHITADDAPLIVLMVEHVQCAGLLPVLADGTIERLIALARQIGLSRAVEGMQDKVALPAAQSDTHMAQFHSALAQFHRSQMQTPAADPILVLAGLELAPQPRQWLFLTLAEYFCQNGRDIEAFAALARRLRVWLPLPDGADAGSGPQDPWTKSAILPFLICAGRHGDAAAVLRTLVHQKDGWVLTPAIAWAARHSLRSEGVDDAVRGEIQQAYMAFVLERVDDYWGRAPCAALIETAVEFMLTRDRMAKPQRDGVVPFCLRAYGLSRAFWEALDKAQGASDVPKRLRDARAQFAALEQALDQKNYGTVARALGFFAAAGTVGVDRFAREVLGPRGLEALNSVNGVGFAIGAGQGHDSADVRALAMPDHADGDDAVEAASQITAQYPEIPQAPYLPVQRSVGQRLAAGGSPDAGLWEELSLLGQEGSGFLGIGLGISLVQPRDAEGIVTWLIDQIEALAHWLRGQLAQATVVRMALMALKTRAPEHFAVLHQLIAPVQPLPKLPDVAFGSSAAHLDTLVVVFSCRRNLSDRVPAMRDAWLAQMGVPYVVVVGGGDGARQGDVVYLDAPDDYEGLPQKTLATIAWVRDNTRFAHMIKVDDDCLLNADLFFTEMSYRKFDYYGRRLERPVNGMDRAWHQEKSSSRRGRTEFDKSAEPSIYADGGSGYALSRDAMEAALDAATSAEGQLIIQASFMEDKMLGDLLALRGITVQDQDYRVTIRRRAHADGLPVASWQNGFLPSTDAPVHLVHLDGHTGQAGVQSGVAKPGLWPKKIWPSYQPVQLGYQSNALELISSEATVVAAKDAQVAVVACLRNERTMLPHFLAHYRRLGVGAFLIADNCSDDGTLEYLAEQPDVALFSVDTDYNLSHFGVAWQQAMLAAFRQDKWSVVADADELLVWEHPQVSTLPKLLAGDDFRTAEAARVFMLDMYPKGSLSEATFENADLFVEAGYADRVPFLTDSPMRGPYSNQPTWTSALRHRLLPGSSPNMFVSQKIALLRYRPWMRLSAGLHFVGDVKLARRELVFAHFKYNATFRAKAETEVARGQHFNNAEEYRKYLAVLSEGRDVVFDPELSVPWHESPFVQDRLNHGASNARVVAS